MKSLLFILITFYQTILSPLIKQLLGIKSMCRYSPTCSTYAKLVIEQQGVLKGSVLAIRRLLQCQPFAKSYGNL